MKRKGLLWFTGLEVLFCAQADPLLLGLWWGQHIMTGAWGRAKLLTSLLGSKKQEVSAVPLPLQGHVTNDLKTFS
jgi:hypothetical protein